MQAAKSMPELVRLLMAEPDAQALLRGFLEAVAWAAGPASDERPDLRARVAAELDTLLVLERELRMLRGATETRWDGRSSAFLQADAIARLDREAWFAALRRLSLLADDVRNDPAGPGV